MNSNKKINPKTLTAILASVASLFVLQGSASATAAADVVPVEPVTSTVSTNMLNVDTAVITKANMVNLQGKDQEIKAKFADLPQVEEKIFAVLVDEIAGGVIDSQFLDSNNSVTFSKIKEFIKIPGIHLYKQSPTDPDFVLRKENFVASTSYLMPYGKKIENNGGLSQTELKPYRGDGTQYTNAVSAKLFTTTIPDVYSFALPITFLPSIENTRGVDASNLLAAVIAEDENGNPLDVRQWVSTDYNENSGTNKYLCRFEFLLPKDAKKLQIHLYKDGLYTENFLCKFLINLNKQPATNYTL